MTRPDDRPLKRLPTLAARKATLEKCVFCPKLCRSACPVSNAEERETLTPWGKMSMAYFVANESVALAESFAAPAWACTGCFGCRESCDHKNDVAGTLFEARSALVENGVAPEAATRALARHDEKSAVLGKTARDLSVMPEVDPSAKVAVLLGCAYARAAKRPDSPARDAIRALAALEGGKVALVEQCCGAPLLYAGHTARFHEHGRALAATLKERKHERLVVVDAGCAAAIRVHHANAGIGMGVTVEHFTERAARELGRMSQVTGLDDGAVRWHDPCQLGRGLGVYDAPRALLSRALGRAPDEFDRHREDARCSGAGGLLPLTMPDTSKAIARKRVDEHLSGGGGTIVTGCASSRTTFEKQGAKTIDLVTVVARALGVAGPSGE
ncbi:MAG: (Fe-S)-binding protein [Deltaproteobacteria bacterium]|nr:(Fe-S)-binding protein [Deltaproteobacteria bacterium]